jgi:RepB plasmid partitioning protein
MQPAWDAAAILFFRQVHKHLSSLRIDRPSWLSEPPVFRLWWLAVSPAVAVSRPATQRLSDEQLSLMERESASLAREFKVAEQTYGTDNLDLVLATRYLSKLLRNGKVVGYLAKNFQELLLEFQRITEAEAAAA